MYKMSGEECLFMGQMGTMDGKEVILRRFGDEHSTLLDQLERQSFEIQLNQAILGRSLSEPSMTRTQAPPPALLAPPPLMAIASQFQQGRRRRESGFKKALKRLLKPILRRRGGRKEVPDPKDPWSWKAFSRSMRV